MTTNTPNKLLGLEIIRFISAFAILIWHYKHFTYFADVPVALNEQAQPFFKLFSLFYTHGFWGVQIFWGISGFIFFTKYRDFVSEKKITGKKFFILRFSRLYPLHLLTLLLVALGQLIYFYKNQAYFVYSLNDFWHFFLQLFMASNWSFSSGQSFNGPIWSISIEILVYFLFFILLRYLGRSIFVNFAVLLSAMLIRKLLGSMHPFFDSIIFFYLGGLTAIGVTKLNSHHYRPQIAFFSLGIGFIVPILLSSFASQFSFFEKFSLSFLIKCFLPFWLIALSYEFHFLNRFQKIIEAAGNMTYSSYLLHFPLQLFFVLLFGLFNFSIPFYHSWFFILYLIIVLIFARFTYEYFEKPAQSLIRKHFK